MSTQRGRDRLYELLPQVYRLRDAERGYPLKALLAAIGEQVDAIEDSIEQLYDNWFIETCEDWVVPYLGDLIGARPVQDGGASRREVARTVALRRRKGTLALLEEVAADTAGWPARAIESYRLLALTQNLRHLRLERGRTVDLRRGDAGGRPGGPLDELAHTVDVRRASSRRQQGRYNLPSVALFVWRLRAFPVTRAQAYCVESAGRAGQTCLTFSLLGHDAPLFAAPARDEGAAPGAGELVVPAPISRRALALHKDAYYGEGKSLLIWVESADPTAPHEHRFTPVPAEAIVAADLCGWHVRLRPGQVAVDPELGRIAFAPGQKPKGVRVSYHYGFSAPIGGGEYRRPMPEPVAPLRCYKVGPEPGCFPTVLHAVHAWQKDAPPRAIIEIAGSHAYSEPLHLHLGRGQHLTIRAADRARPVLRLLDYAPDAGDALRVAGEEGSSLSLDGLTILGRGVEVTGPLARLVLRHTTLVPGWDGRLERGRCEPAEPSLTLAGVTGSVLIERSILGPIRVARPAAPLDDGGEPGGAGEPVPITITDSIVDALDPDRWAIGGADPSFAPAVLTLRRSTIFGRTSVHAIALVENSIFQGAVCVARRQQGCVRYSYVPPGSRTPRRHHSQPDLVLAAAASATPSYRALEALRVRPVWTSTRYGDPGYAQLSLDSAEEILRGADDGGEMGVFHDQRASLKAASLRARLDDLTPAGADVGIFFAT